MDECMGRRTIEYHADEISSEIRLLCLVLPERDLRSVGIIGPGLVRETRHCSDVQSTEEVTATEGGGHQWKREQNLKSNWGT